jgi:hypothetical protein
MCVENRRIETLPALLTEIYQVETDHETEVRPTYIFLGGRCEEPIEFYKTAVKAKVEMIMRFCVGPEPMPPGMVPDGFDDKIMHASIRESRL